MTIESLIIDFDSYELPFDPISEEYMVLNDGKPIMLTSQDARYILDHHNGDNRPKKKGQVNKIRKSIQDKFRLDGQPITFNTNGDLTEKQHTLEALLDFPITMSFPFLVGVGVEPDCFTKTAPAKNRTPKDECQRQDSTCIDTEYSTLVNIGRRHGFIPNQQTVVNHWETWKNAIRSGIRATDEFWDVTNSQTFSQITSTVNACGAIAVVDYNEGRYRSLLDQVAEAVLQREESTPLGRTFVDFFYDTTRDGDYGHNIAKEGVFFRMVCTALDRLKEDPYGDIPLGLTTSTLSNVEDTETFKKYSSINPLTKR